MRIEHLSDAELQSAADLGRAENPSQARHLAACPACRGTVNLYSRLFEGLKETEPRFGLDGSFFRSVLTKTKALRPQREPMPWASGLALSGAAAAVAAVYAVWMPERLKQAADSGMRLLEAALRSGSAWIADASGSLPAEPDGYSRGLLACLAALSFAVLWDALLRRFRQVPVDKRG
ncbi:hypothetical protein JW777_00550 [bacterium]|nr:hypothetical protein [bacterium]